MSSRHALTAPGAVSTVYDIDAFSCLTTGEDVPALDFSSTTFTRPVGMVGLLALMDRMRRQGGNRRFVLMLPESPEVRAYWSVSGIMDALREFCVFEEPPFESGLPEHSQVEPMVRCCHFREGLDTDRLIVEMEDSFISALSRYASLANECCETFTELITNVVYHAESDGGFALAQYCEYSSGPTLEIVVADSGIGIRNSLAKNGELSGIDSDCEAIKRAMMEGITSVGHIYRGFGLCYVATNVQLEDNRVLVIRSGSAIITLSGNGNIGEEEPDISYSGTVIGVTIPLEVT